MAGNKKPRKPFRQKRVIRNPLQTAVIRAGVLMQEERKLLIGPVKDCLRKLQFGGMTNADFVHLCDAMSVAHALTLPGIGLLPDHNDKFIASHEVLGAIGARRNAGHSWIAKADELRILEIAIEYHEIQLEFASAGDVADATAMVDRIKQGAREGNRSERYHHIELKAA